MTPQTLSLTSRNRCPALHLLSPEHLEHRKRCSNGFSRRCSSESSRTSSKTTKTRIKISRHRTRRPSNAALFLSYPRSYPTSTAGRDLSAVASSGRALTGSDSCRGRINPKTIRKMPYAVRTPNAIEPNVAQINITRLNISAIPYVLCRRASCTNDMYLYAASLEVSGLIPTSDRFSQKNRRVDPCFY